MDLNFSYWLRKGMWAAFTLLLISCDSLVSTVDPAGLNAGGKKLVLTSFISPSDTLVRVIVTESLPLFEVQDFGEMQVVGDAEVVLVGPEGRSERLEFNPRHGWFELIPEKIGGIMPGGAYSLQVKSGERLATASTVIPAFAPPIESYKIDTAYIIPSGAGGQRDTSLAVEFTWRDIPGQRNFYRVGGLVRMWQDYQEGTSGESLVLGRGIFEIPLDWDNIFGMDDFISDENFDGTVMSSPVGRVSLKRPTFLQPEEGGVLYAETANEVEDLKIELLHTDEHYFRYHRSRRDYRRANDNPFAEPVLIYSNIQGGLGIFAGYNSFSLVIKP